MAASKANSQSNPWRRIFEEVRGAIGNKRDDNGVKGSINWLRKEMEANGANPNVVRNIIYRDKGKLADKKVLFEILGKLWQETGRPPLRAPELEALLSAQSSADQEILQLLGREKRRAYQSFVSGVRGGEEPRLLVTGRPGSGKTLLVDTVQQALELAPRVAAPVVRLEFGAGDLSGSLARLAAAAGVDAELFEAKLVKVGVSGAYAVQADAQADIARVILEALRHGGPRVLLLHVSQPLGGQDSLGMAPLRLNTPEVPRVNAAEWLWLTLLEPMSRLPGLSLLVTMTDLPARAAGRMGGLEGPIRLSPPTVNEARRFVRARLPQLSPGQQEALVQRSGRSFEELRTLTLLAEIREPAGKEPGDNGEANLERLGRLALDSGDLRLRDFLAALAVLSLPGFGTVQDEALAGLRPHRWRELSPLELAFLDSVPGQDGAYRPFSREFARLLRRRLAEAEPERYGELHAEAARALAAAAAAEPRGEAGSRYLHHLFEARDWEALEAWLAERGVPQALLRRIWQVATAELRGGPVFERVALQVAAHYVKLGSYEHSDALAAFEVLAGSANSEVRAWTQVKRAEGAVLRGNFDGAEALLAAAPRAEGATLLAEIELVRASVARWRAELGRAAGLVAGGARPRLPEVSQQSAAGRLVHAKVAVWAGLIAKDQGDLEGALLEFDSVSTDDDMIRARIAFQKGDVQLKLGRLAHAQTALDAAVTLSHKSEAPAIEQARYLSRRATLRRRRAELEGAAEDWEAALALLSQEEAGGALEQAFERAKVEDERALLHLAQGRFEAAVLGLRRNLQTFRSYQQTFRVDASFRVLRSTLRLALAYWCRATARPYRMPLTAAALPAPASPDLEHARRLAAGVLEATGAPQGRERYGPLVRQALLVASLLEEDAAAAADRARSTLAAARFAYLEAQSRAHAAAALLRGGRPDEALAETARARAAFGRTLEEGGEAEAGDLGLLAWLAHLELQARVELDQVDQACGLLVGALDDPRLARFHEALLVAFGEAVEPVLARGWLKHGALAERLELSALDLAAAQVRLPDALAAHWQGLKKTVAVG